MAKSKQLRRLQKGVEAWNKWRAKKPGRPDLSGADLSGYNLSSIDLQGALLTRVNLSGATLANADLGGANLFQANLSHKDLRDTNLRGSLLQEANLGYANLSGLDLSGMFLSTASLSNADLSNANLTKALLADVAFDDATLEGANLTGAACNRSSFNRANMRGAILKNANLSKATLCYADLRGANVEAINLQESDLNSAKLDMLDFTGGRLSEAHLERASLLNSNLSGLGMCDVNFWEANLTGANLRGSDLTGADLTKTRLESADLSGAILNHALLIETNFENAILSGCSVYGIAAWSVKLDGATQEGFIITPENEPAVTVDSLPVAQFVYLLLNNKRIRDVIDTIGQKAVLILGRFTPERKEILEAITAALRNRGYVPIIFDFEGSQQRDFTETIKILGDIRYIKEITDYRLGMKTERQRVLALLEQVITAKNQNISTALRELEADMSANVPTTQQDSRLDNVGLGIRNERRCVLDEIRILKDKHQYAQIDEGKARQLKEDLLIVKAVSENIIRLASLSSRPQRTTFRAAEWVSLPRGVSRS